MTSQDKILVLLSGGLDSSVLLARAVEEVGSANVIALNIFYGQKHAIEQECAEFQAKHQGVELINADLSEVFKFDNSNPMLQNSTNEIPHESYADQLAAMGGSGTVKTYVAFRNGLFLSYATSVAIQRKVTEVYYGAHADDAAGAAYPDCTEEFINAMRSAIYFGSGKLVTMFAPFWKYTKKDVVNLGIVLKVPFEHTWSCYEGKTEPCGQCATCLDRAEAFAHNGIVDPAAEYFKNKTLVR